MSDQGPEASQDPDYRPEDDGREELSTYEEQTARLPTPKELAEIRAKRKAEDRRRGAPVTSSTVVVNAELFPESPAAKALAALEAEAAANLADEEDEKEGLTTAEIFERMRGRLAKQRESDPYGRVKMDSNDPRSVRPYRTEPTDEQT